MKIFNLAAGAWDRSEERTGWRSTSASVGAAIGSELIGGSLYEVEPGCRLWPYHAHHANEEWLVVVHGSPTVRSPEGTHELREGDVVCFPRGKAGAHQVSNRTESVVRVLMLSTKIAPELVEYADSGKVAALDARRELIMLGRPGPDLDYWDGED